MWKSGYSSNTLQKAVYCYELNSYLNGLEITIENANLSSKRLIIGLKYFDDTMCWIRTVDGGAEYNIDYNFNISYDSKTNFINAVVNDGIKNVIDFQLIALLKDLNYPRMCLTGDPQWSNGSCSCVFNDFKIELSE